MSQDTQRTDHPDAGFTLIEMLIVMIILGIVISALSLALAVTLRAAPSSEARLDDSRATRSLANSLSHDTTSAPPFLGETPQGGIILMSDDPANSNDCGGAGDNLLHLQWTQVASTSKTFVANYRYVATADGAVIRRFTCSHSGSDPFGDVRSSTITSGLSSTQSPTVTVDLDSITGYVDRVKFELIGNSGERVRVDTSSRNPADFFS